MFKHHFLKVYLIYLSINKGFICSISFLTLPRKRKNVSPNQIRLLLVRDLHHFTLHQCLKQWSRSTHSLSFHPIFLFLLEPVIIKAICRMSWKKLLFIKNQILQVRALFKICCFIFSKKKKRNFRMSPPEVGGNQENTRKGGTTSD